MSTILDRLDKHDLDIIEAALTAYATKAVDCAKQKAAGIDLDMAGVFGALLGGQDVSTTLRIGVRAEHLVDIVNTARMFDADHDSDINITATKRTKVDDK